MGKEKEPENYDNTIKDNNPPHCNEKFKPKVLNLQENAKKFEQVLDLADNLPNKYAGSFKKENSNNEK